MKYCVDVFIVDFVMLHALPTKLLVDELDGPRGRIYLLKEMFEGNATTQTTLKHLDNCLTCLACETTCPSGVEFGELAEIGKHALDEKIPARMDCPS